MTEWESNFFLLFHLNYAKKKALNNVGAISNFALIELYLVYATIKTCKRIIKYF